LGEVPPIEAPSSDEGQVVSEQGGVCGAHLPEEAPPFGRGVSLRCAFASLRSALTRKFLPAVGTMSGDGFVRHWWKGGEYMKLLKAKNNKYTIVTEIKKVTIDRIFETDQTFERKIRIETKYGESLDLVLYADQKEQLELSIEYDAPADWFNEKNE
jgi:hypothetical protein